MLEKRKGYGGGDGTIDNWYAPSLLKALMAFEIIWFYVVLYMITALIRVRRNVPSQHRQPYNLLLCTASLFALGLIVDAAYNRMRDTLWLQIPGQGTGEEPDESTGDHRVGGVPEPVDRPDHHRFPTGQNGPRSLTPSW